MLTKRAGVTRQLAKQKVSQNSREAARGNRKSACTGQVRAVVIEDGAVAGWSCGGETVEGN